MTIVPKYLKIEWMGDFFGFNAYAFDINTVYKPAGYFTNVGKLFTDILVVLVSLAGVVAFIFVIISGLKFVTSSGDEKKLDSAKSTLTFSIIGITVVIMSFVIIRIVQAFLGSNVGIVGEGGSGPPPPPPPATASCGLGSTSVTAGGNLGFGYDKFSAGQKIFIWDGGSNRVDLGTALSGPQLVSFTIPASTPLGNYGGFIENVPNPSVVCGSVTVTAGGVGGFPFALGSPIVNKTTVSFSITPAAGYGSVLYIKDLLSSIPIPGGASSISWTGAAGPHSVVIISDSGEDISNTVSFTLPALTCNQVDVSGDGKITASDAGHIYSALRYNKKIGEVGYDSKYDLNGDGIINALDADIIYLPAWYGMVC